MNKKVLIYILAVITLLGYLIFLVYIKSKELNNEVVANQIAFDNYIKNTYGILYDYLEIKKKGSLTKTRIRGYHGDLGYNWIRAYEISAPFMENSFEVWIDNRTHKVFGNNLYETLTTDVKFQHLYSEWVKKQVGIEDENVELKFAGNYDPPYIEFNKITSLSEDYREVFENTHNMQLLEIWKKNISDLSKNNWYIYASEYLVYFDEIKSIVKLNPLCDNNGYLIYLYKYSQDKYNVNDKNEYYGTFDKPNNIDTAILNKQIYEDKAEFEQFENGKIKKYVIDKYGNIKHKEQ